MAAAPELPFASPPAIQQLLSDPWEGVTCFFNRLPRASLPRRTPFHGRGLGLSFLIGGRGTLIDRHGVRHPVAPGCFFRFVDGERSLMEYEAVGDFSECCLYLQREITRSLARLGCVATRPLVARASDPTAVVRAYLALYRLLRRGTASPAAVITAVAALLETAEREGRGGPGDGGLDQVRVRLGQDLDRRVSLPAIAAACGLTYRAMYASFRRSYGMTPGNYRISCRLREARRLLERHSVQDTARRLGYPDPFTFSKQFRAHFGMSPARYQATGEPALDAFPGR